MVPRPDVSIPRASRWLGMWTVVLLDLAPRTVAAHHDEPAPGVAAASTATSEPTTTPAAAAPDEAVLQTFLASYTEGQRLYQAADYRGAIQNWTRAYTALPDLPEYAAYRGRVLFELAEAHMKAHEGTPDLAHLRRADQLYTEYRNFIAADDEDTRTLVASKQAKIAALLEVDRQDALRRQEAEAAAAQRASAASERARMATQRDALAVRELQATARLRRSLFIAGGVVTAASLPLFAVMAAGLARGAQVDDDGAAVAEMWRMAPDPATRDALLAELQDLRLDGQAANRRALGTGVAGGVTLAVGLTLIVVGATRGGRTKVAPAMGRGSYGVQFEWVF